MDPDTTLVAVQAALTAFHRAARDAGRTGDTGPAVDAAQEVAASTDDLLSWVDHGGFLPTPWQRMAGKPRRSAGTNPDATLVEVRQACVTYRRFAARGSGHDVRDAALAVTDAVERLLVCFDRGGGLPQTWEQRAGNQSTAGSVSIEPPRPGATAWGVER